MEDLWCFNEPEVAQAIFESRIPIISAVGHEPDVTISDFVADLRAATPSNAAELAVPDQLELRQQLDAKRSLLLTLMQKKLKQERQAVSALAAVRSLHSPINYLNDQRLRLDYTHRRLGAASTKLLNKNREQFVRLTAKLDAMSPLKVLGRGYSVTLNEKGQLVKSVKAVKRGESLTVQMSDGKLTAQVQEVFE